MFLSSAKTTLLLGLILIVSLFALPALAADSPSPDAIAIRVMPNTEHWSPLSWYNRNVNVKGAPQSLVVDGYEAVRDGRTVYVSAANLADNNGQTTLYTNIYIISYNQAAETRTQDIFGQILNYWQFNIELIDRTGSGWCQPASNQTCDVAEGCKGQFADYSCENSVCVKKCLLTSDCPSGQYCDSAKAKLIRDVKRLADLREVRVALNNYNSANKHFPALPSGSYLPDKTVSVWPSWNETLGGKLGYRLPLDPVNRLGACPGFNSVTCWDEASKTFATDFNDPVLPDGSLAYAYALDAVTNRYKLCTNYETGYQGLPAENRCDAFSGETITNELPNIIFGDLRGKSGQPFKSYFAVRSGYPLDWNSLRLSANWADWASRGWQWESGVTGLQVQKAAGGDDNTRSLSARLVNLPAGKTYDVFDFTLEIADIYGHTNAADGQIRICNPITCEAANAECGRLNDGCGGILLCGECAAGFDCMGNKCVNQQ